MRQHGSASTFSKGLQVLACFEASQRSFTMAEISKMTGFDRATTRRLCLSLVETGFLTKGEQGLSLTPKILAIAGGYLAANDIGLSVQPLLDQVSQDLCAEVSLAVRDGDRAIYVAKSRSGVARVTLGFTVGSALPLLHTAVGRMSLGGCAPDIIDGIFERLAPVQYTEKTETDPEKIRADIAQCARQGFCFLQEEFEVGAAAAAVPVGMLNGSAAVVGTTTSLNRFAEPEDLEQTLDILRQAAMSLRRLSIFS